MSAKEGGAGAETKTVTWPRPRNLELDCLGGILANSARKNQNRLPGTAALGLKAQQVHTVRAVPVLHAV